MERGTSKNGPPVVERIIGVYHNIAREEFEKRLPGWIEKISKSYPVPGHIAEWLIDIEDRNGVPLIKSLTPKASIIHLFWQKHPKNARVLGMRVRSDRLVFHLCREEENPHRFEELLPEMEKWMPLWAEHFGVPNIDGITVEYVNILDGNITPQFLAPNGGLRIDQALTIFASFPGSHKGMTRPLDSKVRLVIDEQKPVYFDVRVRADERSANAVRVEFNARIFPKDQRLTLSSAVDEIKAGHKLALEQFDCFFTEKARNSFGLS